MSDRSSSGDFEEILTGRTGSRTRSAQPSEKTTSTAEQAKSRPGRSRRRFTVDALFSDTRPQAVGVEDLVEAKEIALERIVPDPNQPRRSLDQERLDELVQSIKSEGVLQPIVVRYDAELERYVIVHGERRFRASELANRSTIPALVRDVPEDRRLVQQLMENIVRDDLNVIDRARALRILKEQMNDAPWENVAAEVGIRRSRLFQLLDTGKLPDATQDHIRSGALSEKQSRALQGLPAVYQQALSEAIVDRALPSQLAVRLSRAIRSSSHQANDASAARVHIDKLLDLAITPDDQSRSAQVDQMLSALLDVSGASDQDRSELDELAALLGAPKFTPARVTKSIGDLAQLLSGPDKHELRENAELFGRLQALGRIIDHLVE